MNNPTQLVGIYRLFKLGRTSGKSFNKDIKLPERDLHPVHHDFAEMSNENHQINGLWYEEDKKATQLYWQKKPYDTVKEYSEFEEVVEEKAIAGEIKEAHYKLSQMTKEELIDFADKNGFNIKKSKSAENILAELIEQIETED